MGDSYSSGEGIEPFYGSRNTKSDSELSDWLAHRSQNSWSGQLYMNNNKKDLLKNHKASNNPRHDENDYLHWYFVAASGAETVHIFGGQKKKYDTDTGVDFVYKQNETYLPPQIDVLKYLKSKGVVPDYITLTLGGNDLGFANVITTAAMSNAQYKNRGKLSDQLNEAERKLEGSLKHTLENIYISINDTVKDGENQPCIIVADYPNLLDTKKDHLVFTKTEAKMINKKVDVFNKAIYDVVMNCKNKYGLNIEFVDVSGTGSFEGKSENTFKGHEAYSSSPWINEIKMMQSQDLDITSLKGLASAYSIHPNKKGAEAYARCVQMKIDELEAIKGRSHGGDASKDINRSILIGSWSPDINAKDPEIIEFQYSQDKNAVERLFYTHGHSHDGTYYEYSTGYVTESQTEKSCICEPVRMPEYNYFSFDLSQADEGIIRDTLTGTAYRKFSNDIFIDPSSMKQDIPYSFDKSMNSYKADMEEWFGDDYIILTEGDRIWIHGYDKEMYEYCVNGKRNIGVVYDLDELPYLILDDAKALYDTASKSNIKNPRVTFIISGNMKKDSTVFVFVNGKLTFHYAKNSSDSVKWG